MGSMLEKIYEIVTDKAGFKGRMQLAESTGISRTQALEIADDPEILSRFKAEADKIVGQDIDQFFS